MLSAHINQQPLMHVSQVKLPTSEYSFSRVKPDKSLCNRGCVRPAGGLRSVWRVLFDACEFDADQLGASHYDAMLVWRATVWRVFQFDAWQFGAFCQFAALFIFHVFLTSSHIRHCTRR